MALSAPAVSRALRKHGLVTVPRYRREGVSTSMPEPGLGVRVVVDFDVEHDAEAGELYALVERALRAEGYSITYGPSGQPRIDRGYYAIHVR